MLTPAYQLTLADKRIDTTDEPKASTVVDLVVKLDLDVPADTVVLVLGQVGSYQPARDDEAKIALGYADDGVLVQVLVGTVDRVEPTLTHQRVTGYSLAMKLLRTFVEQTYESKSAGAIVRDLASKAGVETARVEDGILFPAYVADGRRSVYRHVRLLADWCGFDVYLDADGKLVFEKFIGGRTVHVYEYGKHLLELDIQRAAPPASRVEVWGESPGGDASWAWLTKDFAGSKGAGGVGSPALLLEAPALRSGEAAKSAAAALDTALKRNTLQGRLVGLGRPEVKLGDAIRLAGLPAAALNGNYQVRNLTHRITKGGGFMTSIGFRAIAT